MFDTSKKDVFAAADAVMQEYHPSNRPPVTAATSILDKVRSQAAAVRANIIPDLRAGDDIPVATSVLPVCKPHKTEFVRTLITEAYPPVEGLQMIEDKSESKGVGGKLYWLDPDTNVPDHIRNLAVTVNLVVATTHQGRFFLWPLKDGSGSWFDSCFEAMGACRDDWFSMCWNGYAYVRSSRVYRPADPQWEKLASYETFVDVSLRTISITGPDHVVVRRRLGEATEPSIRPSTWLERFRRL